MKKTLITLALVGLVAGTSLHGMEKKKEEGRKEKLVCEDYKVHAVISSFLGNERTRVNHAMASKNTLYGFEVSTREVPFKYLLTPQGIFVLSLLIRKDAPCFKSFPELSFYFPPKNVHSPAHPNLEKLPEKPATKIAQEIKSLFNKNFSGNFYIEFTIVENVSSKFLTEVFTNLKDCAESKKRLLHLYRKSWDPLLEITILEHYKNIKQISLYQEAMRYNGQTLNAISQQKTIALTTLKAFSFTGWQMTGKHLETLCKNNPQLQHLEITGGVISNLKSLENLTNLITLKFRSSILDKTNHNLEVIPTFLKKLKRLELALHKDLCNFYWGRLGDLTNLISLSLTETNMTNEQCELLCQGNTNLKRLTLLGCSQVTTLKPFCSLTKLRDLDISYTGICMDEEEFDNFLKKLPQLRTLTLSLDNHSIESHEGLWGKGISISIVGFRRTDI